MFPYTYEWIDTHTSSAFQKLLVASLSGMFAVFKRNARAFVLDCFAHNFLYYDASLISCAARMPESIAPCIQPVQREVCSPAK